MNLELLEVSLGEPLEMEGFPKFGHVYIHSVNNKIVIVYGSASHWEYNRLVQCQLLRPTHP